MSDATNAMSGMTNADSAHRVPGFAGIVLCGGKSSRMGQPKAWLPFGGEPMLTRIVRLLAEIVAPIVVVAARDQKLPPLPGDVLLARDERDEQGPLEGLRCGLAKLTEWNASRSSESQVVAAYATSCDVPLLEPTFVRRMISELGVHDVAVPIEAEFHHPLAAVYRLSVLPHLEDLLAAQRYRPVFLYERVTTRRVDVETLRDVDPELSSLRNLNRPEDYEAALSSFVANSRLRISVDETSARNSASDT